MLALALDMLLLCRMNTRVYTDVRSSDALMRVVV
jgi:hypothetical protein